jgi:hypothetical protein
VKEAWLHNELASTITENKIISSFYFRDIKYPAQGPHAARERVQCGPPIAFQNKNFEFLNDIFV